MSDKVEIKIPDLVHELMLQTVVSGELFKNYFEGVSRDLRDATIKSYEDELKVAEKAGNKAQIKYIKKQMRYNLNKHKKDVEDFIEALNKALYKYKSNSKEANEIVEAGVDSMTVALQEVVQIKDGKTIIKTITSNTEK